MQIATDYTSSQENMEHFPGQITWQVLLIGLNKLKRIEITSGIFSDHNGRKLEIKTKKNASTQKTWKLNNLLWK